MTDYGRSPGSDAWHPEDPLFGDQWGQQQPAQQEQHQQHQQYSQYQQNQHPQYQQHQQQQHQQQQHQQQPQQQYQHPPQHNPQYQQQGGWDPYGNTGQQQQYPHEPQQQYDSWGAPAGYGHDGYGGRQQPDYYGQDGYPPPQRPDQRYPEQQPPYEQQARQPPQQQRPQRTGPAEQDAPLWDDEAGAADDHSFFSGADDDEEDEPQQGRSERRGRAGRGGKAGKGGKKRRSGMACLVVLVVLGGGVAGVGWFGYRYYQSNFGPPPDFAGQGSGEVQVEIPQGASGIQIGNILKNAGVVKSVDAFTVAVGKDPKGASIQSGVYVLHKQMSASDAVTMMLDPKSQNVLIIAEGLRDTQIYQMIDAKLGLDKGATAKVAKEQADTLGLPDWADDGAAIKDPLEGFLFPSRYSVGKDTKPADVLKQMVKQANAEYTRDDLVNQAKKVGMTPHEVVTIASLVQAEAKEDHEFGKVSRVIYNRLDEYMPLGFDSTINYAKGRSTLNTSKADTRDPSPYNTYNHKGLPPGPIGNPGHQAVDAALHPTKGDWLFFVTVKPGDTRFTKSQAEHDKNVEEFNRYQREHGG